MAEAAEETEPRIGKVVHADHGVSHDMIAWAVACIQPTGFFAVTVEMANQKVAVTVEVKTLADEAKK